VPVPVPVLEGPLLRGLGAGLEQVWVGVAKSGLEIGGLSSAVPKDVAVLGFRAYGAGGTGLVQVEALVAILVHVTALVDGAGTGGPGLVGGAAADGEIVAGHVMALHFIAFAVMVGAAIPKPLDGVFAISQVRGDGERFRARVLVRLVLAWWVSSEHPIGVERFCRATDAFMAMKLLEVVGYVKDAIRVGIRQRHDRETDEPAIVVVASPVDVNLLAALVGCLGLTAAGLAVWDRRSTKLTTKTIGIARNGLGHTGVCHGNRRDRGEGDEFEKVAGKHVFFERVWESECFFFCWGGLFSPVKGNGWGPIKGDEFV
jgi:hypothetical protein